MMMKNMVSWKIVVGVILCLLLLGLGPMLGSELYWLHLVILCLTYSILAMSLVLILRTGHLTLAHAAFMGIGSFSSALMVMKLGLSFWLALPLSGLIAAIIALALGYPILRVRGIYFVIITLAFSMVVSLVALNWKFLGGHIGLTGIPRPDAIGAIDFSSKLHYYYLILLLAALTAFVIHRLDVSRFGMIFRAIGEDDVLAESLGIDILKYKLMAFAIASFFAGLAGAFFAHYLRYVSGDLFGVWDSMMYVIYAVVGGTGSAVIGPVAGVFTLTIIAEVLPIPNVAHPFLFGAVLIQVVLTLPGGLISLPQQISAIKARLPWGKREAMNNGGA